jgi:hypothetical protein
VVAKHLIDTHELLKESPRDIMAKNIQKSLQAIFAQANANPQKRQRLDTKEVSQDRLETL